MRRLLAVGAIAMAVFLPVIAADLDDAISPELASLEALYKHLHSHPELSFNERETAARIARELRDAGYEVTTGVGGNGVVGVLKNGPGPTVMIRTDLDALPVTEQTGREYASMVRVTDNTGAEVGVMHACGHDMHMTVFTGTARMLARLRDQWSGTLVMVGQPAEEAGAGARALIADGLYQRFPTPDYAVALHVSSDLQAGTIGYVPGYALANVDSVDITIRGIGGHGSQPESAKDPVVLAAQVVMGLQTIVSREVSPLDSAVVTVGSIHGGTRNNIIPAEVRLQLTVRSYKDEIRRQVLNSIERIAVNTARAFGLPEDLLPIVKTSTEHVSAIYNDPALMERLVAVWQRTLGADNVLRQEPVMGGEDFGEYGRTLEKVPISIIWLGTIDEQRFTEAQESGTVLPSLHSSRYWPALHPTIETGVKSMASAALELLRKSD